MARLIKRSALVGITTFVLSFLGAQVAAAQWSIQSIPNPPGGGDLQGVSCASGSSCVAVGQRFNGYGHGGPTGLVELWNGTHWRWTSAPKPRDAVFQGVSCVSSGACTAVGYDENARGDNRALVERWNGTRWKIQANPDSAKTSVLYGVSCVSMSRCTAVGSYHRAGDGDRALVEQWHGQRWKIQPNPGSSRQKSGLAGVSCVSKSFCIAVGQAGRQRHPLIERWGGTRWTMQPNGGAWDGLYGVSCAARNGCAAVGSSPVNEQRHGQFATYKPFAEAWDGSQWSTEPSASPSGTIGALDAVSCASSTDCTAVGDGPLAETWDGLNWSMQPVPDPANAGKSAHLLGVSCPSASGCIAIGGYIGNGYKAYFRPLAERWTS